MKRQLALLAVFATPLAVTAEDVDFAADVLPVLETKCMGCHRADYEDPRTGRNKSAKSGYRMDTAELIMGGGDENDANIVAGKADESPSYTYTQLPEEDDYHMPTKGDDLTEEEAAKLKAWIDAGADFGDWTESKFTPEGDKIEE